MITSQLLALRNHIAGAIADLDVTFKHNMNTMFDKLSQQQQEMLTSAAVLTFNATQALDEAQKSAFEKASDLACQATVATSQFKLLPLKQRPPDIFCMTTSRVWDAGPFHDQLLSFRGTNLRPSNQYADAQLSAPTAGQTLDVLTAGGNTLLQVVLPGGINGKPNDMTLRGDQIVRMDLSWKTAKPVAPVKWLFVLGPYIVNQADVRITPKIRQTTYRFKSESFYVEAGRGDTKSATWEVVKSPDALEIADCTFVQTNKNGDSGLQSPLQKGAGGSCYTTARAVGAKGGIFSGRGGGSYGGTITVKEKYLEELAGPEYAERRIMNGASREIFTYGATLPPDSEVVKWDFSWQVHLIRNTGQHFVLTNTQPSSPKVGIASIDLSGKMTVETKY